MVSSRIIIFFLYNLYMNNANQYETIQARGEYAWSLIQEIYNNYPEYIPKLLQYDSEVTNFNLVNETYKGFIRQMRRNNKYEILVADAYTYNFKNNIFESGKRPNTVLYQCKKAIRYCSGNPTYCEYQEGSPGSNIILISGHDGELKPSSIPDRDAGCYLNQSCIYNHHCEKPDRKILKNPSKCKANMMDDVYTTKIARWAADELLRISGKRPHLIINNLHRHKVDMNREIPLATFDVPETNQAWKDFHDMIETAKTNLNGKRGLLLDIHGNAQSEQWNMFGYGIDNNKFNKLEISANDSSIRSLGEYVNCSFDKLIRGGNSLGHFMAEQGITSIPSKDNPYPGNRTYFQGAYTIDKHGSQHEGKVDAVMVEIHSNYRDNDEHGKTFAFALASSIKKYYKLNYVNRGVSSSNELPHIDVAN